MDNTKKVLVVGSWAKEQIILENLKKNTQLQLFCYMDTSNPGIIALVDDYKIGELDDVDNIVSFAQSKKIDLVIPATAAPLDAGVIDALQSQNIKAFGPTKEAAQLESNKKFTRNLLKEYNINGNPDFQVFSNVEDALHYAEEKKWDVAIKPIGLTDGLGIKVFGEQLHSKDEVIQYIKQIIDGKVGNHDEVLLEEKLVGEEFSLQTLVYKTHIVPFPLVQDFKKRDNGDNGPNTASMGSFSQKDHRLSFVSKEDYFDALKIIKDTLIAFNRKTDSYCEGFLYGQFMKTDDAIKLIEYNFRPGDPEWLNVIVLLKDDLFSVINDLYDEKDINLKLEKQATLCKYIVPPKYPYQMDETLKVSFNTKKIEDLDLKIYYSCGKNGENSFNVGCERGIALLGKGDSINQVYNRIEKAISGIVGSFHYRKDIGKLL